MILLNGLAPIMGMTLIQITILNLFAILFEYSFIQKRITIKYLGIRVIVANIFSLLIGVLVLYTVPGLLGGMIDASDTYVYTMYDIFTLFAGLIALFITNVILEFPFYIMFSQNNKQIRNAKAKAVLFSNLITNIPVFILYGWFMISYV